MAGVRKEILCPAMPGRRLRPYSFDLGFVRVCWANTGTRWVPVRGAAGQRSTGRIGSWGLGSDFDPDKLSDKVEGVVAIGKSLTQA